VIRPLNAGDPTERTFVRETAVKVRWRDPRRYADGVPWRAWLEPNGRYVDRWLEDGRCLVWDEDGVVLGFLIVSADGVVRCLYVKRAFRGKKIGLRLLGASDLEFGRRGDEIRQLAVYRPTPSWRAWTARHAIPWKEERC